MWSNVHDLIAEFCTPRVLRALLVFLVVLFPDILKSLSGLRVSVLTQLGLRQDSPESPLTINLPDHQPPEPLPCLRTDCPSRIPPA